GLEVSFSNFDFMNIDKARYQVSLTGPSSFSYNNYRDNKVFLPTLPPGKYTLSVASYLNSDTKLTAPATLHFKVAYAPW
ncbi:hypothetical protein ACKI1O_53555, partial [Streptomyces scabiei]